MEKSNQIADLVRIMIGYNRPIHVSEYCYNCFRSGDPKVKTLIVLPEQLETKGIITIHKPLADVTHLDVIMNYKVLKN